MTLTTDLNTGRMTLSGYGISQTYQTPASGSVVIGQATAFPDGTTYVASSNTAATFSKGSSSGSMTFTTDGTNYTSSNHTARYSAADYGSSDTGTLLAVTSNRRRADHNPDAGWLGLWLGDL
jgi:hypothetical protein